MRYPQLHPRRFYRDPQEVIAEDESVVNTPLFRAQCRWLETASCIGCRRERVAKGGVVECADGRPYGRRCKDFRRG